jgi:hypothetical protein
MLLFPAVLLAHAGGHDIRGTILKIEKKSVVVQRTDGVRETIPLVTATTYRVGDATGTWSDMHDGSRVVVHIGRDGNAIAVHLPPRK